MRPSLSGLLLTSSLLLQAPAIYSQPYTFTTLAGLAGASGSADGTGSDARFRSPDGVAVDTAGTVYVADTENNTIRKITPAGVVTTLAGLAGSGGSADGTGSSARFYRPSGIAVDSAGAVYVSEIYNNTIRKITPAGVVTTLAGLAGASGSVDGTGSSARFYNPFDVAVDSAGTVYVSDSSNQTIRQITPSGVVSTLAGLAGFLGSTDGTAGDARFSYPRGAAVDAAGTLYVSDCANNTIRKITSAGVVSTLAGLAGVRGSADGTGSNARFFLPSSLAVDGATNVYVADSHNSTIRLGRFVPPWLNVSRSAGQLIFSWPLVASNFVIETSSTLSPAVSWTPLTNSAGISGTNSVVTNSLEGGPRFFRLRML